MLRGLGKGTVEMRPRENRAALLLALSLAPVPALSCGRARLEGPPGPDAAARATDPGADAAAHEGHAPGVEPDGGDDAPAGLAAIPDQPLFTNLEVPGFPDAVVALPNGATTPRPVLIVIHGSGDRPDWNCDAWRHITSDRGFVLCPRGYYVPRQSGPGDDKRYTHQGGPYLRRHIDAALAALATRFAGYVDLDRPVLAGFSLGATEVAEVARGDPARFPRIAELEGSQSVWTEARVRTFAAGGGQRVLFGCGSSWCLPGAEAQAARLQRGRVEARIVHANVGHSTDRPLQEAIMAELGWFLAGDPRWPVPP
jgi:predicted esterase